METLTGQTGFATAAPAQMPVEEFHDHRVDFPRFRQIRVHEESMLQTIPDMKLDLDAWIGCRSFHSDSVAMPQNNLYPTEWLEREGADLNRPVCLPLLATPIAGEALPAWLHQFAATLEVSPVTLLFEREYGKLPHDDTWWRKPPDLLLERLASRTGTRMALLQTMTFSQWMESPATDEVHSRFARSRVHKMPKVYSQRRFAVCPRCLAADATPYLRKHWTLGWITICDEHALVLNALCQYCPLGLRIPLLHTRDPYQVDRCRYCGDALIDQPVRRAHPLALRLQSALLACRTTGRVEWPSLPGMDWDTTIALIDLVLGLVWNTVNAPWREGYLKRIQNELGLADRIGHGGYEGVLLAAWHLEEWPYRLLAAIKELNMPSLEVQLMRFTSRRPQSGALLARMLVCDASDARRQPARRVGA
jgi:hypothetical protein